jgi:hypothetical protein
VLETSDNRSPGNLLPASLPLSLVLLPPASLLLRALLVLLWSMPLPCLLVLLLVLVLLLFSCFR